MNVEWINDTSFWLSFPILMFYHLSYQLHKLATLSIMYVFFRIFSVHLLSYIYFYRKKQSRVTVFLYLYTFFIKLKNFSVCYVKIMPCFNFFHDSFPWNWAYFLSVISQFIFLKLSAYIYIFFMLLWAFFSSVLFLNKLYICSVYIPLLNIY